MRIKTIPSSWIDKNGYRFDCNPYMSGGIEARYVLDSLHADKIPLQDLTVGYKGGIYNGPVFKRRFVTDKSFGVPFLTSGNMLQSDLSNVPYLSKADAHSRKLSYLELKEGMFMISCSGAIGNMVYVRSDMDGYWSCQDQLKVVADTNKILPGYLYSFLSSKYGLPIIISGTYGAIIQHLEPEHIQNIPIPRISASLESNVHGLIDKASEKRTKAVHIRGMIVQTVQDAFDLNIEASSKLFTVTSSKKIGRRFDAFHFSSKVRSSIKKLESHRSEKLSNMVESIFEPNRGARLKVDDEEYGIPFLSSSAVFRLDPIGDYLISRSRTPKLESLIVSERDLLLPRSGQLGGVIGKAVLPLPTYYGDSASEHLIRVRCKSREDAYYLWAIFITQAGYHAAIGTSYGSSIPSLDCELIKQLKMPVAVDTQKRKIVSLVNEYINNLSEAIQHERRAVLVLEDAIETAATKH